MLLLDVVILGEVNNILSTSIFANMLKIKLDLIGKLFIIDMGFSCPIIVRWELSCPDICPC